MSKIVTLSSRASKEETTRLKYLRKADTLSKALPYMRRFSGKTFVVKYGGNAMIDNRLSELFAEDIVLLKQVGINPVVVHGGGPQIDKMLDRLSIKSEFVDGLRITDAETVEVVEMVLSGSINKQIVAMINDAGGSALGLSGKDANLLKAKRLKRVKRDATTGFEVEMDLGFVGDPIVENPGAIEAFMRANMIPVIAPLAQDDEGQTYNINADTVAGEIAGALKAERLLLLTDIAGLMNKQGELITEIDADGVRELLADGTIKGGMIPKVETCLSALAQGVEGAVILDGRLPRALLLEIFTEHGAGTMIRA